MKLYHGTTAEVAIRALNEGLLPRSETGFNGCWDHSVQSDPGMVYLTTAYAPYFAGNAAKDGVWGIVEVDTTWMVDDDFRPDEDFLEQAANKEVREMLAEKCGDSTLLDTSGDPGEVMRRRTAWFRDNLDMFQHLWEDSIKRMGNVAYLGGVESDAISRIALYKRSDENVMITMACLDPSISIINYQLCSPRYLALADWMMGEKITFEQFYAWQWQFMREELEKYPSRESKVLDVLQNHPGLEVKKNQGFMGG